MGNPEVVAAGCPFPFLNSFLDSLSSFPLPGSPTVFLFLHSLASAFPPSHDSQSPSLYPLTYIWSAQFSIFPSPPPCNDSASPFLHPLTFSFPSFPHQFLQAIFLSTYLPTYLYLFCAVFHFRDSCSLFTFLPSLPSVHSLPACLPFFPSADIKQSMETLAMLLEAAQQFTKAS